MRKPFIFTCLLILLSCNNQHRAKGVDISNEDKINIDTTSYLTESENSALDAHKGYMQGKFIIADISPCLWGGAFIYFSFYDYPDKVFAAMVYSDVDEKTRVVSNYECRSLTYEDLDLNITQEEIRQFLKESPEQKMW